MFEDRAFGAKDDRPGLAQALAYARSGNVPAVWKLDRRRPVDAAPHCTISDLEGRGVGLRSQK